MNFSFVQNVYEWEQHGVIHQPPIPVVEEGKPIPPIAPRSLYKLVSEHKDVTKVVITLNSVISSLKMDSTKVLAEMDQFKELWNEVGRGSRCNNNNNNNLFSLSFYKDYRI